MFDYTNETDKLNIVPSVFSWPPSIPVTRFSISQPSFIETRRKIIPQPWILGLHLGDRHPFWTNR